MQAFMLAHDPPDPVEKDTTDVSVKVSAPDVDVDSGSGAWYVNPVWIVVGLLAVGILVALIVSASRRVPPTSS